MECEKTTHRSDEEKSKIIKRLNIIEGQVRGIKQMIENDRYCSDVLTQMSAINKALESVENSILESLIFLKQLRKLTTIHAMFVLE